MYSSFNSPGLLKVLTFLQTHDTEYLSGQDLSDVLRISRVAVWKHIKRIQELGYGIESRQKSGYRLVSNSERLLPWEITSNLGTRIIGREAHYFDSIDSTQNQAQRMLDDAADGTVIVAEEQTGGRGRSKRRWVSPKGGIWMSVILYPKFDISIATLFPVAASLALSIAIEKTSPTRPELKWPNDVTVNGKKVAGILVDASMESNRIKSLVLGVGINFDIDAGRIEKELKGTPNFYGAASLSRGRECSQVLLVRTFLTELEKIYDSLCAKRIKRIISEWTKRSSTVGREIALDTQDSGMTGRAVRIEDDGALTVSRNGKNHRVIAGDIVHLSK